MSSGIYKVHWRLKLGAYVTKDNLIRFVVEKDFDQPDMAVVVVRNDEQWTERRSETVLAKIKLGDPCVVEIANPEKSGDDAYDILFDGEVVGLEPKFRSGHPTELHIRAFHKLHRLVRGKRTKTFAEKTEDAILREVLDPLGMQLDWKGPSVTAKHVHQHNQSDLEFARARANRIGCHIWAARTAPRDDGAPTEKLFVSTPRLDEDSGIGFSLIAGNERPVAANRSKRSLLSFTPRLNNTAVVKTMEVRGWNPTTGEEVIGKASAKGEGGSPLGKTTAGTSAEAGDVETFVTDQPVTDKAEADALAAARLAAHHLTYVQGEAEVLGHPEYNPGLVVNVAVNDGDDRFNGRYLLIGTTHRFSASEGGGFTATLRLARDAEVGRKKEAAK